MAHGLHSFEEKKTQSDRRINLTGTPQRRPEAFAFFEDESILPSGPSHHAVDWRTGERPCA
jgi:hypothetical protein